VTGVTIDGRLAQLARETVVYTGGMVLRRALGIVTLPVLVRLLTVQQFGVLAVIATVRDLLTVVFECGLATAADRFYYDCPDDRSRKRLYGSLLVFIVPAALAGGAALVWVGAPLWHAVVPDVPFHPYATLTIATVALSVVGVVPRSLLRVTHRVPLMATLQFANGVLAATLGIALVAAGFGVLGAVWAQLVTAAVFFAVFLVLLVPEVSWRPAPRLVARALVFGVPDVPVRVAGWALRLFDRLILQAWHGLTVVGLYSLGATLGTVLFDVVASAANSAILPFFYDTAKDEPPDVSGRVFADLAAWHAAALAFLGLGAIVFAHEAIVLLATPAYLAAEPVVELLVWASIFRALAHVPSRSIYFAKRTSLLPAVFIPLAAANVGLNVLLVPPFGMLGAAWATLLSAPLLCGVTLVVAQRVYPIPYDYVRMVKPFVALLLVSLARHLLPGEPLLLTLALKVALLAAFPLVLVAMGFVGLEHLRGMTARALGVVTDAVAARGGQRASSCRPDASP
jgi:O-antigen/teichoic acid export membrane protein